MPVIGMNFVQQPAPRDTKCSECGRPIVKGTECLASIRDGKVRKRVCSEDCRLEFDARIWQTIAAKNTKRRSKTTEL